MPYRGGSRGFTPLNYVVPRLARTGGAPARRLSGARPSAGGRPACESDVPHHKNSPRPPQADTALIHAGDRSMSTVDTLRVRQSERTRSPSVAPHSHTG